MDYDLLILFNQTLAGPFLDGLMSWITLVTSPLPVTAALLLLSARKRRQGMTLLLVFVLATSLAVGLQFLLGRPRPAGVRLVLPMPAFPSFPSGHAAGAFACATLAALLWPRARIPVLLGALLVSLSRVYLGHHYPTDVLGGAILGTAVALLLYGAAWSRRRRARAIFGDELCPQWGLRACGNTPSVAPGPQLVGLPTCWALFQCGLPDKNGARPCRPRWAWLLWGQLAVVLLAILGAYLGLLDFGLLALPGADKVLHLLLFGGLAFFSVGWWARRPAGPVLAVLGLLALAEEVLQALSPARSLDWLDLAATLAGVALFGWLGTRARRAG